MPRPRGGDRQRLVWQGIPAGSLSLTGDSTNLPPGVFSVGTTQTVRRVRGEILIGMEGTIAADDTARITIGLGVFSTDAVTLGATAVPDPASEPEYPWMWYNSSTFRAPGALTNATWVSGSDGAASMRITVDCKAQRKMKARESLIYVVQYVDISGAPPMSVEFGTHRVLVGFG